MHCIQVHLYLKVACVCGMLASFLSALLTTNTACPAPPRLASPIPTRYDAAAAVRFFFVCLLKATEPRPPREGGGHHLGWGRTAGIGRCPFFVTLRSVFILSMTADAFCFLLVFVLEGMSFLSDGFVPYKITRKKKKTHTYPPGDNFARAELLQNPGRAHPSG